MSGGSGVEPGLADGGADGDGAVDQRRRLGIAECGVRGSEQPVGHRFGRVPRRFGSGWHLGGFSPAEHRGVVRATVDVGRRGRHLVGDEGQQVDAAAEFAQHDGGGDIAGFVVGMQLGLGALVILLLLQTDELFVNAHSAGVALEGVLPLGRRTALLIPGAAASPLQNFNILAGSERKIRLPWPEGLPDGPLTGTLKTDYTVLK